MATGRQRKIHDTPHGGNRTTEPTYSSVDSNSVGTDSTQRFLKEQNEINNREMKENAREANEFTWRSQQNAQEFNRVEAQKNRMFQLGMSNTAHVREVQDLRNAGLNPVLSANNGASVTSGATASSSAMSGSKADVDTQYAQLVAQWKMNKINNAQALKMQKLNNENALKIARISADAQNYASQVSRQNALTNFASSLYATDTSRYGIDRGYASSIYNANASMYNAGVSASATRYAANQSAFASMYNSDNSLLNNREQRAWDTAHPSTMYQAGGSFLGFLNNGAGSLSDLFKNPNDGKTNTFYDNYGNRLRDRNK